MLENLFSEVVWDSSGVHMVPDTDNSELDDLVQSYYCPFGQKVCGRSPSPTCCRTHSDLWCVVPYSSSCFTWLLLLSFKLASFLQPGCVSNVWQHSAQATPHPRKQDCGSLWHPSGTSPQGPEEEAGCQDRLCRWFPLRSGGRMDRKHFYFEPFFCDNGTVLEKSFPCRLMSLQPPKRGLRG